MLSPPATVLVVWSAVYLFAGVYFIMLHFRRPSHREYLAYGLFVFGVAVWSAGAALSVDADTAKQATLAFQIRYIGGFAAAAFVLDFACMIAEQSKPRLVLGGYLLCSLGIVLDLGGLMFDTGHARIVGPWADLFSPEHLAASPTTLGTVFLFVPVAIAVYATWMLVDGARSRPDLRPVLWASWLTLVAALFDTVVRAAGIHMFTLLEHIVLIPVMTVSFVLTRRFVSAADQLSIRTHELSQSYGELRIVQDELVRKEQLAAVGELSAVIAHEVRNPLAIIKNATSSLRRRQLKTEDKVLLLGILDEEVDRLNRLVRDLLAYARPNQPRDEPLDPRALVDRVVTTIEQRIEAEDGITIEVRFPATEPLPTIHGDPELLRQALTNVADNAMQAMTKGGLLSITAEREAGYVVIAFKDSGSGMSPTVLPKARDPFFTTRPAGTGLGLAIVDRVIRNHRGEMSIESEAGVGTTVRLRLPQAKAT